MSTPPETDEVGRRATESRQLIDEALGRLDQRRVAVWAATRASFKTAGPYPKRPTIRQLAELLGYHPDTLYRYSSGVPMSAAMAARLRAFCATPNEAP